ncbi:MAG: hypothetical protein ACJAX3_002114 [Patiriisocius sp.]|jgi:hypothetical protein
MIIQTKLDILNIGSPLFKENLEAQHAKVTHLDWKPVAGGNSEFIPYLESMENDSKIKEANKLAIDNLLSSQAFLTDMMLAGDVIPNFDKNTILHAGPPISWDKMSGPLRAAILGAIVFEELAISLDEAEQKVLNNEFIFDSCHNHSTVGPMAGVTSYSMPVFIVENKTHNNKAFCTINEGLGKVLRYGANSKEVITKLQWIKNTLYPILKKAIKQGPLINLNTLISQALHMGDECHNRNKAATSLFIRTILPSLIEVDEDNKKIKEVIDFLNSNDHFFLNLSMAAAKACMDAAHNIPNSTLVTAMSRNGTEFGIKISGLGDQWFTGPANYVKGLLFPGYTDDDCNPDIGDSAITETFGIGGFAMASAPAIVQFVGGSVEDALRYSNLMYSITLTENNTFSIPNLNFRGSPTGIDLKKVIELDILPVINTGIAHKKPGIGMVGAGVVYPPKICFEKAFKAFVNIQ